MKTVYKIIFASSWFLLTVDMQKVHYVSRFRNFSLDSDSGDFRLINATFTQDGMEHILTGSFEILRDIRVKSVSNVIYRCYFENAACENFQKWKFNDKQLQSAVYMKNQIWTPFFDKVTPKLNFPLIKKNIYLVTKATLDAKAALVFYPEAAKYFWKSYVELIDIKERALGRLFFEATFFTFVERDKKRGSSSSK